jgi:hypothetical protein
LRRGVALVRGPREDVERRRARLERFLAPLGCTWATTWSPDAASPVALVRWEAGAAPPEPPAAADRPLLCPESGHSNGQNDLGGAARGCDDGGGGALGIWGERPPAGLATTAGLLAAGDRELRALDGSHALFALGAGGRARVVTGAGGPGGCFAAAGGPVEAWATSASAAALLGAGRIALDEEALPALLAFGVPFGERTHVRGVTAVAAGERIDLTPAGPARRAAYWPRAERWAPLPEAEADAAGARRAPRDARGATAARGGAVARADRRPRLPGAGGAVTLLGLAVPTFTFGESDWPDVAGARALAARLGLEHRHHPLGALPEAEVPAEADRDARWFDGLAGVGPTGAPELPAAMSAMVTGAGAEVGRGYSYQSVARSRPRPRTEHVVAAMSPDERLPGAPAAARQRAAAALRAWLEEPGVPTGWRALDALYIEHRVGRWGAARVTRTHPGPILAPFSAPPLARALSALPLGDRLAAGFHHRLVGEVAPGTVLPPMQTQRRGIPAPARRAASALRRRAAPPPAPWPWAGIWHARPAVRAWVADDLLADPRLTDWLGADWAGALRAGFTADDARHAERALVAASLVLWARAADAA